MASLYSIVVFDVLFLWGDYCFRQLKFLTNSFIVVVDCCFLLSFFVYFLFKLNCHK
jgi:hypothetical protein